MSDEIKKNWVPVAKVMMPCSAQVLIETIKGVSRGVSGSVEVGMQPVVGTDLRVYAEGEIEGPGYDCLVIERLESEGD